MRLRPLTTANNFKTDTYGDRRLVSIYEWHGHEIEVCDSALNIVGIISLFKGDLSPEDAHVELLSRLFFDFEAACTASGDNLIQLVEDVMWDVCGLDVTPNGEHVDTDEEPAYDWIEDADRIRTSLRIAYNLNWDEISDNITFNEASTLINQLNECGIQTPLSRAIHYRLADPPTRKEASAKEISNFYELQDYYALKGSGKTSIERQNEAMAALFAEGGK